MSFKSMTITFDPRVMLPLVAATALVGCNLLEPSVEETKPWSTSRPRTASASASRPPRA